MALSCLKVIEGLASARIAKGKFTFIYTRTIIMKHTVIKPLAVALLLGVLPLTISSAFAVVGDPITIKGDKGDSGLKGGDGLKGSDGLKGDSGFKGDKGESGVGLTGPAGPQGIPGAPGGVGAPGAPGAPGLKGDVGAPGAPGLPGAPGGAGAPGLKGDKGEDAPIHTIGEQYQGGIIFWVDASGQHGLITAMSDQSNGVSWNNTVYKNTGTLGTGLYAGQMNTTLAVATQVGDSTATFAAKVAADYRVQGDGSACPAIDAGGASNIPNIDNPCYGDWYLPSIFELSVLAKTAETATLVNNVFVEADDPIYWSSTTVGSAPYYKYAYAMYFFGGAPTICSAGAVANPLASPTYTPLCQGTAIHVRAVRAF